MNTIVICRWSAPADHHLKHLLVIYMKAGRALDSQPCFPLFVPDFVYLSKATWSYFFPAAKLRGIKGPQQPHIPMWRIWDVHILAERTTSRVNSSLILLPDTICGSEHTHQPAQLWALPCFPPLSNSLWLLPLFRWREGMGLVRWHHFLGLPHKGKMLKHKVLCSVPHYMPLEHYFASAPKSWALSYFCHGKEIIIFVMSLNPRTQECVIS